MESEIKKGEVLTIEKAKNIFKEKEFTCLIFKDDLSFTSKERGLKPLVHIIENKIDLKGFHAVDKIIGNAAAICYVKIGIASIHSPVVSKSALETLKKHNISITYDLLVDCILNPDKTKPGPFEVLIKDAKSIDEAYALIVNKMKDMKLI